MRRRIVSVLGLLVACGLANPVAKHPDGTTASSRTRIGVASASFAGDCYGNPGATNCTVQISMGHMGTSPRRAEVIAVRLVVGGVDIVPVPISDVTHWRRGGYRTWDRIVWPHRTTKLSIAVGPIDWAALGLDDPRADFHVEIEVAIDGEPVVTRSIFAVRRGPEPDRIMIMT